MITLLLILATQDTTRLTLARAVERALAQYPTVAAARAAADRAAADLGDARAAWLPRLALDGSLSRYQLPWVAYPLHGFDPLNPPVFDRTLLQGSVSLSWTVLDFGGRAARVRAARALEGAAGAGLTAAEQRLAARAAISYLGVLTARGVLAAQDQRLAALAAEADRVRRLLAEGKAARVEVLRVDAELARARAERIGAAGQLDVAEHDLAQVAGLFYEAIHADSLAPVALADTGATTALLASARAALVARATEASPALWEARRRAEAAAAGADAARATRLPELRLSGAYFDRGGADTDFKAEWQAGLGLSYPLYTGGSRSSQIHRAEADARAASQQLRLAELDLEQSVDRALAAIREAHARVAALESAVQQSAEVARIERLSLDVGSGTQTNYLDAESSLLKARASLVEAKNQEIAARIELARVTGELSPAWLLREMDHP